MDGAGDSTFLARVAGHAKRTPHRTALCLYRGDSFQLWSYGDLHARALRWGERLAEAAGPARRGEVAFVVLPHGIDLYAAFIGAMMAGLAPSMLPTPQVRQDRGAWAKAQSAVIARARPVALAAGAAERRALGGSAGDLPVLEPEPFRPAGPGFRALEPGRDDPALLQHSSGTTGLKKGVVLPFGHVDRHVGMLVEALGASGEDVWASWLPLYHDMGLVAAFLAPLSLGAGVVALDPFAWVAEPMSFFRAVARHRATLAWAPNFAFAHWARTRGDHPAVDASSLRALIDCSEPCRPETLERFAAAFADCGVTPDRLACCYGMAEVVFAATQTPPGSPPRTLTLDADALEGRRKAEAARPGRRSRALLSCGPPLPGVRLRIDAPDGSVGEILVRSPTRMSGYHAQTHDPAALAGGWRRTGDLGLLDEGELFVCGRLKELIIVHGRNLYAGDVEAAVSALPGVKPGRAVALGLADEDTGTEELAIMLEALEGSDRRGLEAVVRESVRGAFGVAPRHVVVADPGALVKSTAGKMSRADNLARLQALLAERIAPATPDVRAKPLPECHPGRSEAESRDRGRRARPELLDPGVPLHSGRDDGEPWEPAAVVQPPAPPPPDPPADPPAADPPGREPLALVARALAECFGADAGQVEAATAPDHVPGWDSLGHTVLLLRLEALAGVRFGEAAAEARTAGELAALLPAPKSDTDQEIAA